MKEHFYNMFDIQIIYLVINMLEDAAIMESEIGKSFHKM